MDNQNKDGIKNNDLSKDIQIECDPEFEKLSRVTLHTKGEYPRDFDRDNPLKVSITLKEMLGYYQVVAIPVSEDIKYSKLDLIWDIVPQRSEFDLIFTIKVEEPYSSLRSFSKIHKCKVKKPYKWKWFCTQIAKRESWIVPAIITIFLTLITKYFICT